MYVPTNSALVGSLTPLTSIDVSLHTFIGISWMVLLPYTALGAALLVYSQSRLIRGQRDLKRYEQVDPVMTSPVV